MPDCPKAGAGAPPVWPKGVGDAAEAEPSNPTAGPDAAAVEDPKEGVAPAWPKAGADDVGVCPNSGADAGGVRPKADAAAEPGWEAPKAKLGMLPAVCDPAAAAVLCCEGDALMENDGVLDGAAGALPGCGCWPANEKLVLGAALTVPAWLAPKEKGVEGAAVATGVAAVAAGAAAEPGAAAGCPNENGAGEAVGAADMAADAAAAGTAGSCFAWDPNAKLGRLEEAATLDC